MPQVVPWTCESLRRLRDLARVAQLRIRPIPERAQAIGGLVQALAEVGGRLLEALEDLGELLDQPREARGLARRAAHVARPDDDAGEPRLAKQRVQLLAHE